MRLLAMACGLVIAGLFKVDALATLAPIADVPLTRDTGLGIFLTGAGAAAGAAYWQDALDKLTAAKLPSLKA